MNIIEEPRFKLIAPNKRYSWKGYAVMDRGCLNAVFTFDTREEALAFIREAKKEEKERDKEFALAWKRAEKKSEKAENSMP